MSARLAVSSPRRLSGVGLPLSSAPHRLHRGRSSHCLVCLAGYPDWKRPLRPAAVFPAALRFKTAPPLARSSAPPPAHSVAGDSHGDEPSVRRGEGRRLVFSLPMTPGVLFINGLASNRHSCLTFLILARDGFSVSWGPTLTGLP